MRKPILIALIFLVLSSMGTSLADQQPDRNLISPNQQHELTDCLVPCDKIFSGGPGKDGIPSIDNPQFITASEAEEELTDSSTIMGIEIDGIAKAYPYDILNWHEIVNDVFGDVLLSITLCPLTGTGIVYETEILGDTNLGVSGKLYENNLIMYDRATDSYYSQMLGIGIVGSNKGLELNRGFAIETTWGAWKAMYPDTVVLTRDTGFSRNYDLYPYGNYQTDDSILFSSSWVPYTDIKNYYHRKTLTVILDIGEETNMISFNELMIDPAFEVNEEAVIFHDQASKTAISYNLTLDNELLSFTPIDPVEGSFGLQAFKDEQTGSVWNILGESISGTYQGKSLDKLISYNAYWFAAVAFFESRTGVVHLVGDEPYNPEEVIIDQTEDESSFPLIFFIPLVLIPIIAKIVKRR